MNIHAHPALKDTGHPQALLGDKVMLAAIALSAAAAVLIGFLYYEPSLAIVGALVFLGLGAAAYALGRGTLGSRLTLALALVSLVALQIQLAHGELEYHFGVFVTLALLLVYLDWRPIVFAAGLFAVHHVLVDRLQAAGLGFYCTTEANFARVLLHAAYVVIQTGLEVVLAVGMGRTAREGAELTRLVRSVNQTGRASAWARRGKPRSGHSSVPATPHSGHPLPKGCRQEVATRPHSRHRRNCVAKSTVRQPIARSCRGVRRADSRCTKRRGRSCESAARPVADTKPRRRCRRA